MKNKVFMIAASFVMWAMLFSSAWAGGTLRLDESAVGEIDPAKASDYADSILFYNLYDTLVSAGTAETGLVKLLADSWKTDGINYEFSLKDNVKFHSGNLLTAEDVVYSYDRLMKIGKGFSNLFRDKVSSVQTVDNNKVKFVLKETYAPFLAALTRLAILDSKTLKSKQVQGDYGDMGDYSQAYLASNSAGTGAYMIVSHNPQELTVMKKNADYFQAIPQEAPDSVRMRYGLKAATVRTLMSKKEHDIASQWLPPEIIKAIGTEKNNKLFSTRALGQFFVHMNTTKPPLDDVHCRKALSLALDYKSMISLVGITDKLSAGSPSNSPLPIGIMGNDPNLPFGAQNMEAAKAELVKCKYKPEALEVSWIAEVPIEERFALLMQNNFNTLGFKTTITRVPWAKFTDLASKKETTPQINQTFISASSPDPDALLYNMYHSSAVGTWQSTSWLGNKEVDLLLEQGRSELDTAKRAEIYKRLSVKLLELVPTIYGYVRQSVYAAGPRVSAPLLEDASQSLILDSSNFQFRYMKVQN